jgi:hypothetical protein
MAEIYFFYGFEAEIGSHSYVVWADFYVATCFFEVNELIL